MFRRHLQLAADVILTQFPEKRWIRVSHDIIKADAGTDENFFHLRNLTELSEQIPVIRVIHLQIFAWFWEQALSVDAGPFGQLLVTGRLPEVGCGTAHIMDIPLETPDPPSSVLPLR